MKVVGGRKGKARPFGSSDRSAAADTSRRIQSLLGKKWAPVVAKARGVKLGNQNGAAALILDVHAGVAYRALVQACAKGNWTGQSIPPSPRFATLWCDAWAPNWNASRVGPCKHIVAQTSWV